MKKLFFSVLRGAGVVRLVSWWHREHTIFLCYHSVTNWPRLIPHEFKLHTSASLFTKHLDYLQRHYRVIPLGEYLEARRARRRLPRYTAVLTYPHGRASATVREMAASLGYSCAFTGELGANDAKSDLHDLRRVTIAGDDDPATFAARVSGLTWWYDRLRAAFKRARASAVVGVAPATRDAAPRTHEEAAFVQMKKPSSESIP